MSDLRRLMTIYCDEPSHTDPPIGPCMFAKHEDVVAAAALHHVEATNRGAFLVATMYKYAESGSRLWAPHTRQVTGVARRGGGAQKVPVSDASPEWRQRYRLQCDWCGLTVPVREPRFSDILNNLAAQDITAVSLKVLGLSAKR